MQTHDYLVLATSFSTLEGKCVSFHCNIIKNVLYIRSLLPSCFKIFTVLN